MEAHGHHRAIALHLLGGSLVPRVICQARVKHGFNLRAILEILRDFFCVIAVAVHAHRESFDATSGQVSIEGRGDRTDGPLEPQQLGVDVYIGSDHCTTDDVGMPAQILGGRMQHVVSTQADRVLQVRRSESIVHDQRRAAFDLGDSRNIANG